MTIGAMLVLLTTLLWKWSKALLGVILVEAASTMVMVLLFFFISSYSFFVLILFLFFVSESLILLTSLYSSLRSSGASYSSLTYA